MKKHMKSYNEYKVYVVIVTYNAIPWIDKCIKSCVMSSYKNTVIVVDNNSKDDTVEFIKKHFEDVVMLGQTDNFGFGRGNNIGLEYALGHGADFVYLLNQDAWLENDTIEILVSCSLKNKCYGLLSPLQLKANGSEFDPAFVNYILANKTAMKGYITDMLNNRVRDIYDIPFFQAAHWFLTSECVKEVGGFSDVFKHYGEDDNYIHRIIKKGYKIGIVPNSRAVHDHNYKAHGASLQSRVFDKYTYWLIKACNPNKNIKYKLYFLFLYYCSTPFYYLLMCFFKTLKLQTNSYFFYTAKPSKIIREWK